MPSNDLNACLALGNGLRGLPHEVGVTQLQGEQAPSGILKSRKEK